MTPPVLAVVGPTAAGKSDLAVDVALRVDGEVVNADSMQLYRGMDVGTAKLSLDERRGVAHHLLDIWPVSRAANVAEYQHLARDAVAAIRARGRVPIVVGGSGLYVRAVLDDLDFPGTDPHVRSRLEDELAALGPGPLHARLAALDPASAAAILPSNGRRLVRALEVVEITGRPFVATLPEHRYAGVAAGARIVQVGIELPRPVLDARVQLRAERMFAGGLVEEVRALLDEGLRNGRTASRALGYAQVLRHLDGKWTADEALADTVRATRRFVRSQETWFRRDPRVRWVRPVPAGSPSAGHEDLVDRVVNLLEGG